MNISAEGSSRLKPCVISKTRTFYKEWKVQNRKFLQKPIFGPRIIFRYSKKKRFPGASRMPFIWIFSVLGTYLLLF